MSDECVVQVYSICPSSLAERELLRFFGPSYGRLIAKFPRKDMRKPKSWAGNMPPNPHIKIMLEMVDALENRGAFVSYSGSQMVNAAKDSFDRVARELEQPNKKLTGAIVDDFGTRRPDDFELMHGAREFFQAPDQPHNMRYIPFRAESLMDCFRPVLKDSNTFKIIDPYIFEIRSAKDAESRFKFLKKLIDYIHEECIDDIQDKKIEIFGKAGDGTLESLKGHIRQYTDLIEYSGSVDTQFFGLSDTRSFQLDGKLGRFNGKEFHIRYFYAGPFLFYVENSFQERQKNTTQEVRYIGDRPTYEFISSAYHDQSSIYEIKYRFSLADL